MNICAFGYHNKEGGRHWVIKTGLEKAGYTVIECHTAKNGFIPKYFELIKKYWKQRKETDVMLVTFLGQYTMPLAWILAVLSRKPIVFDAFISLYDSQVDDRKVVRRGGITARIMRFLDWFGCKVAKLVILDTEDHKDYFIKNFSVPPQKIIVLPIGCRTDVFRPKHSEPNEKFTVLFHGTYIPLQGIEIILRAAEILKKDANIQFSIIGKGQTRTRMKELAQELNLTNVTFTGFKPVEELIDDIANADVCLGIFGTTDKADRVIPHKAYEIICMGKPLITGSSTAARAVFKDGENALLSARGNPNDLAEKILMLKNDPNLRESIAKNGRELFLAKFQPKTIVAPLTQWLKRYSSQA